MADCTQRLQGDIVLFVIESRVLIVYRYHQGHWMHRWIQACWVVKYRKSYKRHGSAAWRLLDAMR